MRASEARGARQSSLRNESLQCWRMHILRLWCRAYEAYPHTVTKALWGRAHPRKAVTWFWGTAYPHNAVMSYRQLHANILGMLVKDTDNRVSDDHTLLIIRTFVCLLQRSAKSNCTNAGMRALGERGQQRAAPRHSADSPLGNGTRYETADTQRRGPPRLRIAATSPACAAAVRAVCGTLPHPAIPQPPNSAR